MTATLRPATPEDRGRITALYSAEAWNLQKMDPALAIHAINLVVEKDGEIVATGSVRITGEILFAVERKAGTPAEKWGWITGLLDEGMKGVRAFGIEELHLGIPQSLPRWAGRLMGLPGIKNDERFHLTLNVCDWDLEGAGK
jgi:hypothetical protein